MLTPISVGARTLAARRWETAAGGAIAGAQPREVKPRMALQEPDEMLAHHAGGAENAYFDSRLHKSFTMR